jgi:tRNA-specific adenosine deaminase 3
VLISIPQVDHLGTSSPPASLFNHSSSPNVNFIRNSKSKTISFRTVRRIKAGEELCICYAADESKLWFVDTSTKTSKPQPNGRNTPKEDGSESEEEVFPTVEPDDLYDAQGTSARREERANRTKDHELRIALRLPPPSPEDSLGLTRTSPPTLSQTIRPPIISPKPIHYTALPSIPPPESSTSTRLPPPLHSTPTPSPNIPTDQGDAEITADLDWRAEDWLNVDEDGQEPDIICKRIKGPTEIEEDRIEAGTCESIAYFG